VTFVTALHEALAEEKDSTSKVVHELVAKALERLDPGLDIRRTDYFTHSFVPDLILNWGPQDERQERHVHLRFDVTGSSFAQDLDILAGDEPIFMGMTDRADLSQPAWAENGVAEGATLVTQSVAVDELDAAARTDSRSRGATMPLVRRGYGRLDEPAAERIVEGYSGALHSISGLETDLPGARNSVSTAFDVVEMFLPEVGRRELERALQSEWVKHGGDPFAFPSTVPWDPELLEPEELREVLLSLLESRSSVAPETWQRNAGFIRAEDIGQVLGRSMRGGRFNEMAHALLLNWTAKWVWASRDPSPPIFDAFEWLIEDGLLGLAVSDLRVFFADDGRHFKDKESGNPLPRLSEAEAMLSHAGVMEVGLRGTTEGIRYESLVSNARPFERIREIIIAPGGGEYRVGSVSTIVPGTDWIAEVDLDRQLIDFKGEATPVATSARLAARFFARGIDSRQLDHFLATGRSMEEQG
jgi:hypothetical protein